MAAPPGFCIHCGQGLTPTLVEGRARGRCDGCGWIYWDPPRPVVLVLAVAPSGRVVLTRDERFPAAKWGLVAGYVEQGETVEDAALRELREESGLDGAGARLVGSFASGETLLLCVRCSVPDGPVRSDGHSEMERSLATQIELAPIDLSRVIPGSPALRLLERFVAGELGYYERQSENAA